MANYDKDMAEERIIIENAKKDIYQDDKEKKKKKKKKKKTPLAMYDEESPAAMSNELKYGGPVIDQMQALSQMGAMKVLKHSKSRM
tara:strand:- start:219 stop:476 length:258 start_codon:yes stop_codon:yes gene_type:complete